MFGYKFYDKYGRFKNEKFSILLDKAIKASTKARTVKNKSKPIEINLFNYVSQKEVWHFVNKLSVLINSGVDVKGAFNILSKQIRNPYLKKITEEIKLNIDYGVPISETMINYPKVFDNLMVSLIRVGEKTGGLGNVLIEIDKSMLESLDLKAKVKGAMIYPIILFSLTMAMMTAMMVFIIPRISESFTKTGTELPKLTQIVVAISDFFINEWYIIIFILLSIFIFYKLLKSTPFGETIFAWIAMRLPVFGYIVKRSNMIYFMKSFTLLLDSGVLLLDSLKISSKVLGNTLYRQEVMRIKNEVENGLTISKSLGLNMQYEASIFLNEYFTEEMAYVINTGEETGTLSKSLKKISYNYSKELKRYIGNLSTMMEPMIIVIVGGMVGTIVVAIMLPFFQLGEIAKKL